MANRLNKFPMDLKCAACGKIKGKHKADTGACPYGNRDRTGGYSFSSYSIFVPKAPKIENKKLAKAVAEFARLQGVSILLTNWAGGFDSGHIETAAQAQRDLADARYHLFTLINEDPNAPPKKFTI
jgi:hypothetical protein